MDQPSTAVTRDRATQLGLAALVGAFAIWGVLPLYLRLLRALPAPQIAAHRLVFCCVFVLGYLALRRDLAPVRAALIDRRIRTRLLVSGCLITINWVLFVWAATNDRLVESSLGYFINPLVNVLLGVLALGERLRRMQWLAVLLAAAGVTYLTWFAAAPPWIALTLAASFGAYGLIRKTVAVDAMPGLAAETVLLLPLGVAYLAYAELTDGGALRAGDPVLLLLLAGAGLLTALPLWLFAYGARRVRYSTVGLVQYFSPTLQLLEGILLFGEAFDPARATGFGLIWIGLAVYAADGVRQR
jgi:chloramphenicol-sensitive protein RarD